MLATSYTGEPKIMEPEKCDEIGWYDLNNLPTPLMPNVQTFFDSNPECLCGSRIAFLSCHGKK